MAKDSGQGGSVDPRFDRRFQRGFDGGAAPVAPATPAPVADEPRVRETEPDTRAPAPVAAQVPVAAPAAARNDVTAPDDDRPLPRFNPFRLGLLAGSVACILLAAWLSWQGIDSLLLQYGGGTDPWMRFIAQLDNSLPAPLLTAGLIGLVLWLAVGVVSPRRSREHD